MGCIGQLFGKINGLQVWDVSLLITRCIIRKACLGCVNARDGMLTFSTLSNSRRLVAHTMSHTNKEAVFEALWKEMERLAKSGVKAEGDEARRIAHHLISYAELPMLYRIRAHMALACGKHSYVWHAQEAVRLATKSIETDWLPKESEAVSEQQAKKEKEAAQALLKCAQEALDEALKDHAELEAIREEYKKSGATGKWFVKYGGGVAAVVDKTRSKPAPAHSEGITTVDKPTDSADATATSAIHCQAPINDTTRPETDTTHHHPIHH